MGGKGSGRPRTKLHGDYSKYEKGKQVMKNDYRLMSFAYKQGGKKYYGIRDRTTGETYKRISPETYEYVIRRFGVEDKEKVFSRMEMYTSKGIEDRALVAKQNIVSALNNIYDAGAKETITINGIDREFDIDELKKALEKEDNDEKWIDLALRNTELLDSFFVVYRADTKMAPSKKAGLGDKVEKIKDKNEDTKQEDEVSSVQREQAQDFLRDLVTTFKV